MAHVGHSKQGKHISKRQKKAASSICSSTPNARLGPHKSAGHTHRQRREILQIEWCTNTKWWVVLSTCVCIEAREQLCNGEISKLAYSQKKKTDWRTFRATSGTKLRTQHTNKEKKCISLWNIICIHTTYDTRL